MINPITMSAREFTTNLRKLVEAGVVNVGQGEPRYMFTAAIDSGVSPVPVEVTVRHMGGVTELMKHPGGLGCADLQIDRVPVADNRVVTIHKEGDTFFPGTDVLIDPTDRVVQIVKPSPNSEYGEPLWPPEVAQAYYDDIAKRSNG